MNIAEAITEDSISLQAKAEDWRQAIRLAGDLLVKNGITTDQYTEQMIAAVEQQGPYIVIAPKIALAHTRPGPSVLKTGLTIVTLADPVNFDQKETDPVWIVFGFAAKDDDAHLDALAEVADVLADSENVERIVNATTKKEVIDVMRSKL
jgi:PTS system ascorbate-specific IIA component